MKKILENMDSAAAGERPAAGADAGSMKAILESINKVQAAPIEECGDNMMASQEMPMSSEGGQPVTISVTASGKENVNDLMDLIKLAGGNADAHDHAPMVQHDEPEMELPAKGQEMDMATMRSIMSAGEDDEAPAEEEASENWANSPDEEYGSEDDIIATGDDMHRPKNPKAIRVKDPAVESIRDQLWAALSEKKTAEGRGAIMAGRGKKKLKASRGNEDIKTTEGSRGKKSRGKKSRG